MMWKIKVEPLAAKALKKLENQAKQRIESFIDDLATAENPRSKGKALQGNLKGAWRYRVGDYRLICNIQDDKVIILVLELGHRKDIYQ